MKHLALIAFLALGACGSKAPPPAAAPAAAAPPAPTTDCDDYEHQVDLCRADCPACAGTTPGNACNVCAEACADKLYCEQCQHPDHCVP
ncbi:MAG: hypothetical protein KA201_13895 [Kofleriaceae bacterium]|nr:hypothetical protein [Kofleriaceae bacterium]